VSEGRGVILLFAAPVFHLRQPLPQIWRVDPQRQALAERGGQLSKGLVHRSMGRGPRSFIELANHARPPIKIVERLEICVSTNPRLFLYTIKSSKPSANRNRPAFQRPAETDFVDGNASVCPASLSIRSRRGLHNIKMRLPDGHNADPRPRAGPYVTVE